MILEYRHCIAIETVYPGTRTQGIVEKKKHNALFHLWAELKIFLKTKKDVWNKLTEDTDSYPETYENVLFKTSDGRIYYGCCDSECKWEIELDNENIMLIDDVVEWRKIEV